MVPFVTFFLNFKQNDKAVPEVEKTDQTGKFANCATEIKLFRIFARLVFESARLVSELAHAVLNIIHSF
jgi:hypothetical protein